MTKDELIAAINEKGFTVPGHITGKAGLKAYYDAIEAGYDENDLKETFPPPAVTLTPEAVAEMIRKAIADDRAGRKDEAAVAVNNAGTKDTRPDLWNSRNAAPEDFLPEGFRVFHSQRSHTFDKFFIDGRHVNLPFSKIIMFDEYIGPETQGFGVAHNLAYMCMYVTYSKTERDLFLKDARWGGEFWTNDPTSRDMNDELELSMLVSNITKRLESTGHADLMVMCNERGIKARDIETMRAAIALHDAKETQRQRKLDMAGRSLMLEKESMLGANG